MKKLLVLGVLCYIGIVGGRLVYAKETELETANWASESESEQEDNRPKETWDSTLKSETEDLNGVIFTKEDGAGVDDPYASEEEDYDVYIADLRLSDYKEYLDGNTYYDYVDISALMDEVTKIEISGVDGVAPKSVEGFSLSSEEISKLKKIPSDWVNVGEQSELVYEPYFNLRFYTGSTLLETWVVTTDYDVISPDNEMWISRYYMFQDWFENLEETYGISKDKYVNRRLAGTYFEKTEKYLKSISVYDGDEEYEESFEKAVEEGYESVLLNSFQEVVPRLSVGSSQVDPEKLNEYKSCVITAYGENGTVLCMLLTDFKKVYATDGYEVSGKGLSDFLSLAKKMVEENKEMSGGE